VENNNDTVRWCSGSIGPSNGRVFFHMLQIRPISVKPLEQTDIFYNRKYQNKTRTFGVFGQAKTQYFGH
jgi:hypothetical protein